MLKQIRYFQTVVECRSFTEAAEKCYISQSAISQQIQALENTVGVELINREKRRISLTPAGELFYRKSLGIVAQYDELVKEVKNVANRGSNEFRLGVLLTYGGEQLQLALSRFVEEYPDVLLSIEVGSHETLSHGLQGGKFDAVMSDQRRSFASDAHNLILQENQCYIEIARNHPLAKLDHLTRDDCKDFPCILVSEESEHYHEKEYYQDVYGFVGEFQFAPTIKDARLMVVSQRGFMPVEGTPALAHFSKTIASIPFYRNNMQFERNLCLFWMKNSQSNYIDRFSQILLEEFQKSNTSEK